MSVMRLFNKRKNPDGSNTFIVDACCMACGHKATVSFGGWTMRKCGNCGAWRDRGSYYGRQRNDKLPFTVVVTIDDPYIKRVVEVMARDPKDALEEAIERILGDRPDMDVDRVGLSAYPASDYQYMVFRGWSYAAGMHNFDMMKMSLAEELAAI